MFSAASYPRNFRGTGGAPNQRDGVFWARNGTMRQRENFFLHKNFFLHSPGADDGGLFPAPASTS